MSSSTNTTSSTLRLVPPTAHNTTYTHLRNTYHAAPSAPGLHDPLRAGLAHSPLTTSKDNSSAAAISAHPLEQRLKTWEATQEKLRADLLRRTYGIAEPVRRAMELKVTREGEWRPLALRSDGGVGGMGSVHEEILRGRDDTIDWEDVFTGEGTTAVVGVQEEIERKVVV